MQVEVLSEAAMKKLGMGSLLAVGQGSDKPSHVVVMQWKGAGPKGGAPIAIVGKGVTFDTGGISLKPAGGMEDMKGDMAGAACVVGLMQSLAERKAKVNAVGVIGLVENMPGGGATRPGDVVTAMSGTTIEVLNTDAEGRMVLADCLWYTQDRFKPKAVINLATLTGAVMVALGKEHAGLFSNNDELSDRLVAAGKETGETAVAAAARTEIRQDDRIRRSPTSRTPAASGAARFPPRSSCSASSRKARRGRISTSPARPCRRSTATSIGAGARASACGCWTG